LINPRHQQRLADAIFSGVRTYFYESPPPGTLFAQMRARGGGAVIASNETSSESRASISN
jgi:N-acetylmuramoyl-L-alanine amidase